MSVSMARMVTVAMNVGFEASMITIAMNVDFDSRDGHDNHECRFWGQYGRNSYVGFDDQGGHDSHDGFNGQ